MKAQNVDEYIASAPSASKEKLKEIRKIINKEIPEAEEVISYQIACFKLKGKYIVYFAGWEGHVSIYPIPKGDASFRKDIEPYVKGKGTLKFKLDEKLPVPLIKKVVKYRIEESGL